MEGGSSRNCSFSEERAEFFIISLNWKLGKFVIALSFKSGSSLYVKLDLKPSFALGTQSAKWFLASPFVMAWSLSSFSVFQFKLYFFWQMLISDTGWIFIWHQVHQVLVGHPGWRSCPAAFNKMNRRFFFNPKEIIEVKGYVLLMPLIMI